MLQVECSCGRIAEVRHRRNGKKLAFKHCVNGCGGIVSAAKAAEIEARAVEDIGVKGDFFKTTSNVPNENGQSEKLSDFKPEQNDLPENLESASNENESVTPQAPVKTRNALKMAIIITGSVIFGGGLYQLNKLRGQVLNNTSDGAKDRGVLRLEKSEEVSNTILEDSDGDTPSYTVDNSELDGLLNDASTSKADTQQQEKEHTEKSPPISSEEAIKYAVKGLAQLTKIVNDLSGKNIVLGELPTTLFAVLTAPLIQKYKTKIDIDPQNVDLDSWVPELMAVAAVGVVGLPVWLQTKSDDVKGGPKNGDKSKPSA